MENLDKHYLALGLQRGATQEEIRSAFRQMVEQYHPDKDSSLDAQMKYHEAQQAYAALSNTAGAKTSEQTAETQQTTRDNNFTGAERNTTGGGNAGWYADDEKDTGEFSSISLDDYFYRWKFVWTVLGSIVVIYMTQLYLSPSSFTSEASVRLFIHTTVFVSISWLILGYIRCTKPPFGFPPHVFLTIVIVFLGGGYSLLLYNFTLQQEFIEYVLFIWRAARRSSPRQNFFFVAIFCFTLVFYIAMYSLEKGGMRAGFSNVVNFFKYLRAHNR